MNREIKIRLWHEAKKEMRVYEHLSSLPPNYTALEVMQYTGLKDKNGKEIYEGDIYKNCQLTGLCQVFFYGGAFCAGPNIIDSTPLCWDIQGDDLGIDNFNMEIEIIGNIYENPELLK